MLIIEFAVVFCLALYLSLKIKQPRWIAALLMPLTTGVIALLHNAYWMHKTNCGKLYNLDIGCANAGGSWDVILGLVSGLCVLVVGAVIITKVLNTKASDK